MEYELTPEEFNKYMKKIAPPELEAHNMPTLFSYRYAFALGCAKVLRIQADQSKDKREAVAKQVFIWHIGKPWMWEQKKDLYWEGPLREDYYEIADQILSLFPELKVLGHKEKFLCSLVSKFPYKDVKDVIAEACEHQLDKDKGARDG